MTTGATFSPCRRYRYALWRTWYEQSPPLVVIGLNPSTADEAEDDPTIARCRKRAEMLGLGGLVMLNLFAWRSTDPKGLTRDTRSPIEEPGSGSNHDELLLRTKSGLVLCGWGNHGDIMGRGEEVRRLLTGAGRALHVLRITKQGQPEHPLYLPYALKPQRWEQP